MNNFGMLKKKKFLTLLLTKDKTELSDDFNKFKDLILFLVKYAFILNDTTSYNNFSKRQFPPSGDISTQNSNGARYLDPKYSRWLSTDPALGEYVPSAGKSNEVDKLPGMGGIFNSVNLSLYHYAGNNPVRYVDPDGREAAVGGVTIIIGGIIVLYGTLYYMTTDEYQESCKGLADAIQYGFDYACDEIKSWISSDYSKAEDVKDKNVGVLQNSLFGGGKITSVSPSPMPHGDDDEKQHDINRSIKDAKKISSNEDANDFAIEKGYKDAHELKKQYVGKENISKYNIYRNNKTGEAFLINRDGSSIIRILD